MLSLFSSPPPPSHSLSTLIRFHLSFSNCDPGANLPERTNGVLFCPQAGQVSARLLASFIITRKPSSHTYLSLFFSHRHPRLSPFFPLFLIRRMPRARARFSLFLRSTFTFTFSFPVLSCYIRKVQEKRRWRRRRRLSTR